MKLAEALIARADLKARIAKVLRRMKENVLVQEDESPAEEVDKLASMYESMMSELEGLIIRINRTNSETMLGDINLADAIAKRDCLKSKIAAYSDVKNVSLPRHARYSRTEIKIVRTIDVSSYQRMIDDYSRRYRELDTKIQERNWTVELL
jgi:phage protein D